MSSVINTNVKSLVAQNALTVNNRALGKAMEQLSTGKRINTAADDAAGLAISNKMTSQIRGLNQAVRNANDGISMLQTAEGATQEVTNMLQRMRELAVQASNDTYSTTDRASLDAEFQALLTDIGRISTDTKWNGVAVSDGTGGTSGKFKLQVGADAAQQIEWDSTKAKVDATTLGINTQALTDLTKAQSAITAVNTAIGKVDTARSDIGALINRLTYAADNMSNISMNTSASRSRILDADYASATTDLARTQIIQQAATAMLAQANQQPQTVLSLLK